MSTKSIILLRRIIRPFGLRADRTSNHIAIRNQDGKRVGTMAGSPKNKQHAIENTVKQLIENKALPPEAIERVTWK